MTVSFFIAQLFEFQTLTSLKELVHYGHMFTCYLNEEKCLQTVLNVTKNCEENV